MSVGHQSDANDPVEHLRLTVIMSRPVKRLSILIAIAGILLTFVFWRELRAAEAAHINRMTSMAAHAIAANLAADIQDRSNSLQELSRVWGLQNPPPAAEWESFATMFIQHHRGVVAVEHADSDFRVREIASLDNDQSDLGMDIRLDPSLHATIEAVMNRRGGALTPISFLPSGKRIRTNVVPIYNGDTLRGFVLAKVDVVQALDELLRANVGLGYSLQIIENGQEVYKGPSPDNGQSVEWGQTIVAPLPDRIWTIRTWPNPQLLSQLRTRLPGLALLLPLTFTGLLLVMLRFVQTTSKHAREMEDTNEQLNTALQMRQLVEDELRESRARFEGVLEISADAIISANENQQITLFNQGAEAIFGYKSEEVIGKNLEILLPQRFRKTHCAQVEGFSNSAVHMQGLKVSRTVPGLRKDGTEFPLDASISKLHSKGGDIYTAILRDVTERRRSDETLKRAHDELEIHVQERTLELQCTNQMLEAEVAERKEGEDMLRELSGRLLQAQDEERRRVARELHDSTAQYLAALALNIAFVQKSAPELPKHLQDILSETGQLVDSCSTEIRTMSYLLHPPLLDDLGLTSALQWYAVGFTKRSGIKVALELSPDLGRLPADHERAYFRIVQECLTNVRKHSGATEAKIQLLRRENGTRLEVSDNGCGMPGITQTTNDVVALLGVGIAGMRERVRQLGGRLDITSTGKGSVVSAVLPTPSEIPMGR
jgi:PAS domain S-box-containing protein